MDCKKTFVLYYTLGETTFRDKTLLYSICFIRKNGQDIVKKKQIPPDGTREKLHTKLKETSDQDIEATIKGKRG